MARHVSDQAAGRQRHRHGELDESKGSAAVKQTLMKICIENCRALAREACAEAKVRVARYLETGDLADLHPERNSPAEQGTIASGAVRVIKPPVT
jgi:hypothetical protein